MKKITVKILSLLFGIFSLVQLNAQCNLNASFTYTLGSNGVVNFSSTTTGTIATTYYMWSYGDSSNGNGVAPTHTYATNGNYTVVLTAINGSVNPPCQSSATVVITVNSFTIIPCNLAANCTYSIGGNGNVYFMYNTSTGTVSGTTYTLDFGDNTTGNAIPIVHTYSANGSYTVTLTANNNFTNSCVSTKTFVVIYSCFLTLAPSATIICAGGSVTLAASGSYNYIWNTGATGPNLVVSPLLTSVYTVSNQAFPCLTTNKTMTLVVNPAPTITAVSSSSTICSGQAATLTANGANTYSWNTGAQTAAISAAPSVNSTYTVKGTDGLGCSSSQTVALTVLSLPMIMVVSSSSALCIGQSATLTANGANSYSWNTGPHTAAISVTPSTNSSYIVSGINSHGCAASQTIALTVLSLPVITVSPTTPTICSGSAVNLTANGANTYLWEPIINGTSSISVSPGSTSTYTVIGTDMNNCTGQTVINVIVQSCTGIEENQDIQRQLSIYPNPSQGLLTAEFEFDGEKEILIFNSVGSLIRKITTSNGIENIDLSAVNKGVYFIRVSTRTFSSNYKVIIQ